MIKTKINSQFRRLFDLPKFIFSKNNAVERPNSILDTALKIGLVKKKNNKYIVTDYGHVNGCYITRSGGIGFSRKGILLLKAKS